MSKAKPMTIGAVLESKQEKKPKPVMWLGEKKCNICNETCVDVLIDGRTIYGPWAVMCVACHKSKGVGIGTGKGQQYRESENGDFVKDAG